MHLHTYEKENILVSSKVFNDGIFFPAQRLDRSRSRCRIMTRTETSEQAKIKSIVASVQAIP
ncbi:hypothetical protein Syun_027958 [Stephania yunnanensis]|uniref:Uncharacterized protein n=1 Tax=Stephania yunnanensis TaxID=152371 RepID=A0AAP0ELN9_9MAGN